MIFAASEPGMPSDAHRSQQRQALLDNLLDRFRLTFRGLDFQLLASSGTINAQAVTLEGRRCVRLYGGLAFHPLAGPDALIFTLLHEAGHHLASGRRLPWDPRLACECAADEWAANAGGAAIRRSLKASYAIETALSQLGSIYLESYPSRSNGRHQIDGHRSRGGCWASSWPRRCRSILAGPCLRKDATCPLAERMLTFD